MEKIIIAPYHQPLALTERNSHILEVELVVDATRCPASLLVPDQSPDIIDSIVGSLLVNDVKARKGVQFVRATAVFPTADKKIAVRASFELPKENEKQLKSTRAFYNRRENVHKAYDVCLSNYRIARGGQVDSSITYPSDPAPAQTSSLGKRRGRVKDPATDKDDDEGSAAKKVKVGVRKHKSGTSQKISPRSGSINTAAAHSSHAEPLQILSLPVPDRAVDLLHEDNEDMVLVDAPTYQDEKTERPPTPGGSVLVARRTNSDAHETSRSTAVDCVGEQITAEPSANKVVSRVEPYPSSSQHSAVVTTRLPQRLNLGEHPKTMKHICTATHHRPLGQEELDHSVIEVELLVSSRDHPELLSLPAAGDSQGLLDVKFLPIFKPDVARYEGVTFTRATSLFLPGGDVIVLRAALKLSEEIVPFGLYASRGDLSKAYNIKLSDFNIEQDLKVYVPERLLRMVLSSEAAEVKKHQDLEASSRVKDTTAEVQDSVAAQSSDSPHPLVSHPSSSTPDRDPAPTRRFVTPPYPGFSWTQAAVGTLALATFLKHIVGSDEVMRNPIWADFRPPAWDRPFAWGDYR